MTNNHHQPLDVGAAATSFNWNVPLQQIDIAIGNWINSQTAYNIVSLTTLTLNAASFTLSSIPATYSRLELIASLRCDEAITATVPLEVNFNGDTGANYDHGMMQYYHAAGIPASQWLSIDSNTCIQPDSVLTTDTHAADRRGLFIMQVLNYADTQNYKLVQFRSTLVHTNPYVLVNMGGALWKSASAITSITLTASGRDFVAGSSYSLRGIK